MININKKFENCPYKKINDQTAVVDASPHRLVSVLYSGLLEQLSITKGCIDRIDIEGRSRAINKSVFILGGLYECIDEEIGNGYLAGNLKDLYNYMIQRLSAANITSDEKIIDEVINLLLPIQKAWLVISIGPQKK